MGAKGMDESEAVPMIGPEAARETQARQLGQGIAPLRGLGHIYPPIGTGQHARLHVQVLGRQGDELVPGIAAAICTALP